MASKPAPVSQIAGPSDSGSQQPAASNNCSLGHSKCIIIWRFYPFANIKFLITPRHWNRARKIQVVVGGFGGGFWESSSFMGTGAVKQLIKGQMSAMSYIRTYILYRLSMSAPLLRLCFSVLLLAKGKGFGFTVLSAAI